MTSDLSSLVGCFATRGLFRVMESTCFDLGSEWEPPRVEPVSSWPVDRAHLARYTLGDEALEREVLDLFAGEVQQRIEAFKQARTEKDWKMAAHTLKGSARAVGAGRVAQLAQQAERLSVQDREACATAVLCLEEATAEASAYIARLSNGQEMLLKRSA